MAERDKSLRALRRLAGLRWGMLATAVLALVVLAVLGVRLPWVLLGQALLTLALFNAVSMLRAARSTRPQRWLQAALVADTLTLTELLLFSGGAANPLSSLYILPVLCAALLSPGPFALGMAALSMLAYGLLFRWHLPWPLAGEDAAYAFSLHLAGMWLTFAVSALLIGIFVSRLARQLDERERLLSAARETQLRDEQVLALAMQAAGAAHSLSTPLNTLTLLAEEWQHEHGQDPAMRDDLVLMQHQLQACRKALERLKHGAEPARQPHGVFADLARHLDDWRALRPRCQLVWSAPQGEDPQQWIDPVFWPALFNLIDNAADAGGGQVTVTAGVTGTDLFIDIINREGCLSPDQLERAGLGALDSGKPDGLGIGVLLSHATLTRLGGHLALSNRDEGGVHARVTLPRRTE